MSITDTPDVVDPNPANEGQVEAPRSLRDELEANFKADGEGQGAVATDPTAPVSPASSVEGTAKARNELGQFVKQEHKAAEPQTPSASGEPGAATPKAPIGAEAAQPQAIAPPVSWSPAAKAAFPQLPENVRQEILKREGEINAGMAQRSQDAERLNRLNTVLGPRGDWFRLKGVSESQAVEQLFAASDYLERDPVGALLYLSRQTGVDPRHLAQVAMGQGGQPQQQPGQLDPNYQRLMGEVQTLKQSLSQQQQAAEQAQMDDMLSQVATFASDPAHVYFENVREPMAALVRSGQAQTLQDAYEQATWAHPEIRPLLMQQHQTAQQAAAAEAAKARTAQARHASGSITGSPTPGVNPGQRGPAPSLRDELERNFAEFTT